MTWRVLISAPYFVPAIEEFRSRLQSAGIEIVTVPVVERLNEADLLEVVATIDGAICGDDQFTERVLRAAPRLKVLSKWGTGIDSIDKSAAAELGIRVCNTPNAFTDAVADTTLGYILSFARQLPWMDRDIRDRLWKKSQLFSLRECTLGVIGVGNIGKAVVRRARAFGARVVCTDPVLPDPSFIAETGIILTSLDEVLAAADFVSVHCDLNRTSFHLIGSSEFKSMKRSAYVINTARGPIIDEVALIEALRAQTIAGAALDVFEVEPLSDESPLRQFPNCLFAPHNANSSFEARRRVHESTIENLLKALREE
jgi:phosphoglycerate dehydrogenase-like enzyme